MSHFLCELADINVQPDPPVSRNDAVIDEHLIFGNEIIQTSLAVSMKKSVAMRFDEWFRRAEAVECDNDHIIIAGL